MDLPRPLVLFLAFCGGGALFAGPLLLAAVAMSPADVTAVVTPTTAPPESASPISNEPIGELDFVSSELLFEPSTIEVDAPGVYVVTLTNDGALPHDLVFHDGTATKLLAAGEADTIEVMIPAEGLAFMCSVPGHADGGMTGEISVSGEAPPEHGGHDGEEPAANAPIEANPEAAEFVLRDPNAPELPTGEVHEVELVMTERVMTVAEGYEQLVWTFGDEVPGPVMRVKVGDTVRVTLVNPETNELPHSIDFHSSMVAWNDEMRSINPGEELVYEFEAKYAGVYMYHCGTSPALHHIANGMFGMIIVEPEGGLPEVDREIAIVQSEWYLGEQGEVTDLAKAAKAQPEPDFVVFNGVANQYLDNPIQVEVGETVRVFVLNAGPSIDSSFHVVGTIFHSVTKEGVHLVEGNEGNWGSQAVDLSPAQGAIVEMRFDEDGLYPIVTHAFNFVGKGALGLFQAGDGGPAAEGGH